ncbi:MAG: 50S ribosomal protein L15 [Candidatus Eremiobacteraeota bacterium]|nr:50S ribosomal protein L15 [Candidatus Eremiobacteraeota bacterium]
MARKKAPTAKKPARRASATKTAAPKVDRGPGLGAFNAFVLKLASVKPNAGSRPKRTRVGRGHGSGMVKTAGEGGKGQTVRSGGGKGPAFEGGQTPWARRLPHRRGYSQKARDIGHFRSKYAIVNLVDLTDWDNSVEVNPETLKVARIVEHSGDGVKVLGGSKAGKTVPAGLRFRGVVFSRTAREALTAAGATLESEAEGAAH